MRRIILALGLVGYGTALAAPPNPVPPREEPAGQAERAGESDDGVGVLPALPVPQSAVKFKDPAVAALAAKILTGQADLRDRRAWYSIGLLYAPFDALPPADWRSRALRDGDTISIEARKRQAASKAGGATPDATLLASYSWSNLGPTNYNVGSGDLAQGRASSLWVNPANTNFIYAGFADGGVWKTTNGGASWTPISDFEVSTSIGGIDVLVGSDTSTLTDATVYAGLGEGNTASDSVDGAGVLKSVDGGASWTLQTIPWTNPDGAVNARWRHSIRRILIDTNVAAAQSVWVAGDGGVYHTADGGATWSLVTGLPYTGKPGVGGCWPELATDFVIDTTVSPSRLYAAFGARSSGSPFAELTCTGVANDANYRKNNGIYRSTDGGTTWTKITGSGSGFPAAPGQVGRITLLQAPSAKKQMYALISCVNGTTSCANGQYSSLGIFRTSDASAATVTWAAAATTNFCATQGWYDLTGAVDPTNPGKFFVAGLDVYLSTTSGTSIASKSSWTGTGAGFVHADQHQMVYPNATTVFVACDGGVFKGTISGTTVTWANLNAGGLSTLQFYGIGQHPVTAARIHGGLQDNGEAYTASGATWSETAGGDGGFSATDWSNGEIAYEEYVYGAIARSTTGGASSWSCIQNFGGCSGCGGCVPDGQTSFIAPVALDANAPATLYTGSKYVYRNTSASTGSNWSAASPDLVGTAYDSILNVHSAPNNGTGGTIWVTTSNGKVWVTSDDAANWTDTTRSPLPNNPVLPNRAAPWVATHPADGRKAIVVYSGWNGSGSQPGHVFRTQDGGATWTDVSGALPDEPVFTVAIDPARPNDVYIGSEYGVYVNTAGWTGSTWTKINAGQLPNVHVHQLEFSRANGKLRAATHGRGIWELSVSCPSYAAPVLDPPVMNACGAQLSWTPSGSTGTTYDVYRASGNCPAGGFVPIATGLTGTTYLDTAVSGGLTYSYKVTTAETAGSCESGPSACAAVVVDGACPCNQAPVFGGVTGVTAPFATTCSLSVAWNAGAQLCGGAAPVYNIYRGTSANFTPAPGNRIATCVAGTSFTDTGVLSPGSSYVYVVRAEDASGAGGGPCRGGTEEGNQIRKAASPQGVLVPAPFSDGAEGAPQMTMGAPLWSQSATRAHSGTQSYFGNGTPLSTCSALTTPLLVPGPVGSPSLLSFYSWRDNLESTYDGGVVEITTDGGTNWTKLPLTPDYPGLFGSDSSSCANTAQTPASGGFTGNDGAWQGAYNADLTSYAGLASRIRFDLGTDPGVSSTGWYVDDIAITNTSQPTACSSGPASVLEVSSIGSGLPLLVTNGAGGQLVLSYEDVSGVGGYNVYEGSLGTWYSHAGSAENVCGAVSAPVAGRRETVVTPDSGSLYFLVTAYTAAEGPSGFATGGEIPPAASTCAP
jgi:Immune inhibitor A peptidase M6